MYGVRVVIFHKQSKQVTIINSSEFFEIRHSVLFRNWEQRQKKKKTNSFNKIEFGDKTEKEKREQPLNHQMLMELIPSAR